MNKSDRKRIAEKIAKSGVTYGAIQKMLIAAYDNGGANSNVSMLNKGMTKATAYNIFWSAYKTKSPDGVVRGDWYSARNAIVEFGEYGNFSEWVEPSKKEKFVINVRDEKPIDPRDDGLPF